MLFKSVGLINVTKEVNVYREQKKSSRNVQRLEVREEMRTQQRGDEAEEGAVSPVRQEPSRRICPGSH